MTAPVPARPRTARTGGAPPLLGALVGSMVADAVSARIPLQDMARATLVGRHPKIAGRIKDFFDPAKAVAAKAARGGTAPAAVRISLRAARARVR